MKKLFFFASLLLVAHIVLSVCLFSGNCTSSNKEGFAIYLTRDDIPPAKMEMLSHADIADKPIIGISDIISYDAGTHEIKLTDDAYERIAGLEVPVQGKSFLVCVDKSPIYWGAFWTPLSSLSFDGITIWQPLSIKEPKVIAITLGYPAASFHTGEDPRNDKTVMESLEKSGKLVNRPSADKLPHSFKGYELYSWIKDGQWYFTLITGTDRTKTPEEIVSGENGSPQDGWVNIRATGLESVKTVLSRLPAGEDVSWLSSPRAIEITQSDVYFSLPEETVTDAVKEQAVTCGLNLWIS